MFDKYENMIQEYNFVKPMAVTRSGRNSYFDASIEERMPLLVRLMPGSLNIVFASKYLLWLHAMIAPSYQ